MARSTQERPLAGKVALVTGGSRGIGAAIAKRLAADGASVAVTYSKGADAAASVVKEIERGGGKAIAIQADAADADAVRNAVERTVATLGRLDVLVNNAGTVIPMKVEETTLADFDRVFAVNVRGVFVATQAALKHLKTGGRILRSRLCGQRPRRLRRDAGGAQAPEDRRANHHDRLVPGRARVHARHGALRGNQRGRQDVHARAGA